MSSLNDAELEITAILSQINLNMQDVLDLSVGDIIPLEKKITDDIQICIENVPWFNAKLGNSNIKKAVKITEILNDKNQF
jgi:flagellar motor switch protein FliM